MSVRVSDQHMTVRRNSAVIYRVTSEESYFDQIPLCNNRTLAWFRNLPREAQNRWKEYLDLQKKTDDTWTITTKRCLTPSPKHSDSNKKFEPNNPELISKQRKLREGCWRVVQLSGQKSLCMVQKINTLVTVKILDARIPVGMWPEHQVFKNQLELTSITTSETLDELIVNLRKSQILHSTQVEFGLRQIDRKDFCPKNPYHDCAIDIGNPDYGVCISSPHMHVWAAELLINHLPQATHCLDVGSGSGYFTALMAYLAPKATVHGIDFYNDLIEMSSYTIKDHYPDLIERLAFYCGDGELGIDNGTLYHAIHVGFMCIEAPPQLIQRLAPGGRMLVPVTNQMPSSFDSRCLGGFYTCVDKDANGDVKITKLFSCSFVPSATLLSGIPNS